MSPINSPLRKLFRPSSRPLSFCFLISTLIWGNIALTAHALPDIDALWDYNQPRISEARFRSLMDEARDGELDYVLQLKTQLARAVGLQRRFDEAHAELDEVAYRLPPQPCIARLRYLLERGRVYHSGGKPDKAVPLFEAALKLATGMKADFYAVDAAHMLGIAAEPRQRLAWNLKAMSLAEQSRDERAHKWLGPLYNNIGWTYHDQGDYAAALVQFEKALAWHTERRTGEGMMVAEWSVARALRSLGRVDEALARQQALLAARSEHKLPDDGYVAEEIAECLLALERKDEASPFFAKAWELLSQDEWLRDKEARRLQRLRELGKR